MLKMPLSRRRHTCPTLCTPPAKVSASRVIPFRRRGGQTNDLLGEVPHPRPAGTVARTAQRSSARHQPARSPHLDVRPRLRPAGGRSDVPGRPELRLQGRPVRSQRGTRPGGIQRNPRPRDVATAVRLLAASRQPARRRQSVRRYAARSRPMPSTSAESHLPSTRSRVQRTWRTGGTANLTNFPAFPPSGAAGPQLARATLARAPGFASTIPCPCRTALHVP